LAQLCSDSTTPHP